LKSFGQQISVTVTVGLQGPAAIASQEGHRRQLILTESERRLAPDDHLAA
jgi:hypothetical protein